MNLIYNSHAPESLFQALLKTLKWDKGEFEIKRFENKELYLTLKQSPNNQICVIVGSIAPPEQNLVDLLLLASTLKQQGATRVVCALPYLSYTRHDHDEPLKSLGAEFIGQLFKASGIDQIITCDIHSQKGQKLFQVPVVSIDLERLFSDAINKDQIKVDQVIAPDEGAKQRAFKLASLLNVPYAVFHKTRDRFQVVHKEIDEAILKDVVIIDDMLDTGDTLVSCVNILKTKGALNITIAVSHGLFTLERWQKLLSLGVKMIYTTSTIEHPANFYKQYNIRCLDVAPYIGEVLCQSL